MAQARFPWHRRSWGGVAGSELPPTWNGEPRRDHPYRKALEPTAQGALHRRGGAEREHPAGRRPRPARRLLCRRGAALPVGARPPGEPAVRLWRGGARLPHLAGGAGLGLRPRCRRERRRQAPAQGHPRALRARDDPQRPPWPPEIGAAGGGARPAVPGDPGKHRLPRAGRLLQAALLRRPAGGPARRRAVRAAPGARPTRDRLVVAAAQAPHRHARAAADAAAAARQERGHVDGLEPDHRAALVGRSPLPAAALRGPGAATGSGGAPYRRAGRRVARRAALPRTGKGRPGAHTFGGGQSRPPGHRRGRPAARRRMVEQAAPAPQAAGHAGHLAAAAALPLPRRSSRGNDPMGLKANGTRLALVSLVLALSAFVLASRVGAAPLPAATVSTRPSASAGANGRVTAIARAGDRVYIGGSFTSVGGQPRGGLAALDAATGQLVASWRADVTGGPVEALAASPDGGTLYVGGDFTAVGGTARRRLAAVSTAGGAVGPWRPAASGGMVMALAAGAGRVYAGGKFTSIGGVARPYLAALSTDGAVLGWDPRADASVRALALDGGRLYAAGDFHNIGGRAQRTIAALDPASAADSGWHPQATCPGLGLTVASGTVYLACAASTGARRWSAGGDGDVHAVAVLDGVAYTGGHFTTIAGASRKKAAAFDAASGQLLAWDPPPDSTLGVFSVLADGDWLWMGGDFTSVGGVAQAYIARLGFDSASTRTQTDVPGPKLGGRGADRFADPRVATLPHPN